MSRRLLLAVLGAAMLALAPAQARAGGGGTIDRDQEFQYNDTYYLYWITGDGRCDKGGFCFRLAPSNHREPYLSGVFGPEVQALSGHAAGGPSGPPTSRDLYKINIPAGSPDLIGQFDGRDGPWFVYDTSTKKYLIETPKYEDALATWKSLGLPAPSFEDASDGPKTLSETFRSKSQGWAVGGVFLSPCLLGVLVIAGLVYAVRRKKRAAA